MCCEVRFWTNFGHFESLVLDQVKRQVLDQRHFNLFLVVSCKVLCKKSCCVFSFPLMVVRHISNNVFWKCAKIWVKVFCLTKSKMCYVETQKHDINIGFQEAFGFFVSIKTQHPPKKAPNWKLEIDKKNKQNSPRMWPPTFWSNFVFLDREFLLLCFLEFLLGPPHPTRPFACFFFGRGARKTAKEGHFLRFSKVLAFFISPNPLSKFLFCFFIFIFSALSIWFFFIKPFQKTFLFFLLLPLFIFASFFQKGFLKHPLFGTRVTFIF